MSTRAPLVSFAASLLNIEAMQGDVVAVHCTVTQDDAPFDANALDFEAGIITPGSTVYAVVATGLGELILHFTEAVTGVLDPGRYRWFLREVETPRTWLGGVVEILRTGTGRSSHTYTANLVVTEAFVELEVSSGGGSGGGTSNHGLLSGLDDNDHTQYLLRSEALESYVHTQTDPTDVWTINHNLGERPMIETFTSGGIEVDALITHLSVNQATAAFNSPQAGFARCV